MTAEQFNPKETPLSIFADELTTCYLFILTCALPAVISTVIDTNLGQIALAAGGVITVASFVTGRIRNRNTSEGDYPKPLAGENPSTNNAVIVFRAANATN